MLLSKRLGRVTFPEFSGATLFSLLAIYVIWGSTYLALAVVVHEIPPFLMSFIRFIIAGTVMFTILKLRGEASPTRIQWRNAAIIGTMLLVGGQGGVAFAEQWVASGLAALAVATIPLWAVLFASYWERRPSQLEVAGLGLGAVGIVILNFGTDIWIESIGGIVLFFSPICWAFASMWSRHLEMPKGLMNSAAMMLCGSLSALVVSLLRGEQITEMPSLEAVGALLFLVVFGSVIAFSAYNYLLANVSAAVATSYAYVNPIIAVLLGAAFNEEPLAWQTFVAAAFILTAVFIITSTRRAPIRPSQTKISA